MTQPIVEMTGKVDSFTTSAKQTDEGPRVSTRGVLTVTNVSGDLDALVGYSAAITLKGLQGKFGGKA